VAEGAALVSTSFNYGGQGTEFTKTLLMSAARKERALAAGAAATGRASHGWPRCALGLAGLGAAAAKPVPGEQRPTLFRSWRGHDRPVAPARTPPRLRLAKGASSLTLRAKG
jgi:hypothetical protein